jgi:hypothetical protein
MRALLLSAELKWKRRERYLEFAIELIWLVRGGLDDCGK